MGRCSSINSVHEEHSLPQRNRNESFFGMKPRLGLANLNLDKEVTDEIWTEEQLNEVLDIEEAPIEYQIEAPGLRNVINLVQDQVSTLAEGEVADEIDGGSDECHLCRTAVGVQIDWFPQSFHTINIVICISIISMNNMMETSGPRHEEA